MLIPWFSDWIVLILLLTLKWLGQLLFYLIKKIYINRPYPVLQADYPRTEMDDDNGF